MKNEKQIEHDGIVKSILGDSMIVEILSKSACSGCNARSLCSSSEQTVKEVSVVINPGEQYAEGDKVTIVAAQSLGIVAVVICYVLPVVIMLLLMALLTSMHLSDVVVGAAALGVLVPYFLVIYMMRDKFKKKFIFKTKNSNKETWKLF